MLLTISPSLIKQNSEINSTKLFFFLLSLFNVILFAPTMELASLFVGEVIIALYIFDLLKTPFRFHIYQLLLIYFYYSLCVTNAFSNFDSTERYSDLGEYYLYSYLVNIVYFIFFFIGYHLVNYKHGFVAKKIRQNKVVILYFIFSIMVLVVSTFSVPDNSVGYSDRYIMSSSDARKGVSTVGFIGNGIYEYLRSMLLFTLSNPFVYAIYNVIMSLFGYISSGIKGGVLTPIIGLAFLYQVYYKRVTIKSLMFIFPISSICMIFFIGTTSFRGDLSLNSLFSLSLADITGFLYYFLISPESSHIVYTADIIKMIDQSVIDFRFGFDYIKFFLYPFKDIFDDFGYSSFVQYIHVSTGSKVSQGLYLGMAGELFWNFGPFYIFPALFLGFILKKFTNWAFSLSISGIIAYVLLGKVVLWIYYRGIANELMITLLLYMVSMLVFIFITMLIIAPSEHKYLRRNVNGH